jgi:predicted HicB family RNase H-like nuclease
MIMQHGPYVATIEYDEEARAFHGRVANLAKDGFDFWGATAEELRCEFERSASEYEAFCREIGKEPEKPYSGQFLVRTTPELHRAVALEAARANKSLNAWVTETLARTVGT